MQLIQAYQTVGHVKADVDPLNLKEVTQNKRDLLKEFSPTLFALDIQKYGFTQEDLKKEYFIDAPDMGGFFGMKKNWKLGELIQSLEKAYCGKMSVEYAHITK